MPKGDEMLTPLPEFPGLGRLMSAAEVAAVMGQTTPWIHLEIRLGRLKAYSVGGRIVIAGNDLTAYRQARLAAPQRGGRL
jgi:hypothetical protein